MTLTSKCPKGRFVALRFNYAKKFIIILFFFFADCVDKVDCRLYGPNACSGKFKDWAHDNCPLHCKFCTGKSIIFLNITNGNRPHNTETHNGAIPRYKDMIIIIITLHCSVVKASQSKFRSNSYWRKCISLIITAAVKTLIKLDGYQLLINGLI